MRRFHAFESTERRPVPDTRIYKYGVSTFKKTRMPRGAQLLQVGQQGDAMVVWAIIHDGAPDVQRDIFGFTTGSLGPPPHAKFINTVQRSDGLVFHYFDCGEIPLVSP